MNNPTTYTRSYQLTHAANPAKVAALESMLTPWVSTMTAIKQVKIGQLKTTGKTSKLYKTQWDALDFGFFTRRQLKSVEAQVDAALATWRAGAIKHGRRYIHNLNLPGNQAKALYTLNKAGKFWEVEGLAPYILTRHRFPVFTHTRTMHFDRLMIDQAQDPTGQFAHWLTLRGLGGQKIHIPLTPNPYLEAKASQSIKVSGSLKVSFTPDGAMSLWKPMEFTAAPARASGRTIALDWGLTNALATSDGELLGRELFTWLKKIDTQASTLQADLQRRGIKPRSSKRFRAFTHRVRETFKNTLGYLLNKLAATDIRAIVVEALDFRGGGLSRSLNRLLSRAARGEVVRRLTEMPERYGIEVIEVNPAYTSKTCSNCHRVPERGRTGERFTCPACGYQGHADINAAINILNRGRNPHLFPKYAAKEQVLAQLRTLT